MEEIILHIKTVLNPPEWAYRSMVAGEDSERAIWAEIHEYPLDNSPRLVVIRNAEKLKDLDRLTSWITKRLQNPKTHVILVSSEERLPRAEITPAQRRANKRPELLPHVALAAARGHAIECRPFTNATAKHAVKWVVRKVPMRDGVAAHLLNRANGDLRIVRDVCTKLAVLPTTISLTTVNDMLTARPRDSFTDALIALDRKTALKALAEIDKSEYSSLIGFLDSRLVTLGVVHDMVVEHRPNSEIARALGSQGFLVNDVLDVSKHYDARRRFEIRQLLATADETIRGGEHTGVMEVLVNMW